MAQKIRADFCRLSNCTLSYPITFRNHGHFLCEMLSESSIKIFTFCGILRFFLPKIEHVLYNRLMDQSIRNHFQIALVFLLEKEGRGAQIRLAREKEIDRGYLNAIIQGRKPGSENVREQIADYFHMPYEEMLALGRRLQDGSNQSKGRYRETEGRSLAIPVVALTTNDETSATYSDSLRISETIRKAIVILESSDETRLKLTGLIDALYSELMARKESDNLRAQVEQLASRIVHLEGILAEEKNSTRKSA
jgi:hypothetical protein